MKQQTEYFTPAALNLSVVTAALADGIPQGVPVRRALWLGAVGTVLLAGLAGPVGLAAAFFGFLLSIVSTEALGVPYLAPHLFPQQPLSEDGVLRRNYRQLSRHRFNIWQKRERGKRQS